MVAKVRHGHCQGTWEERLQAPCRFMATDVMAISAKKRGSLGKSGWWWLEHDWIMTFHILGMSSSQLTNSIIFQRGRYTMVYHQPVVDVRDDTVPTGNLAFDSWALVMCSFALCFLKWWRYHHEATIKDTWCFLFHMGSSSGIAPCMMWYVGVLRSTEESPSMSVFFSSLHPSPAGMVQFSRPCPS